MSLGLERVRIGPRTAFGRRSLDINDLQDATDKISMKIITNVCMEFVANIVYCNISYYSCDNDVKLDFYNFIK